MKRVLVAVVFVATLSVYLLPRLAIYAFGYEHNIVLAQKINNKFSTKRYSKERYEFCVLNSSQPWIAEESADNCDVVHLAHESDCNSLTRGNMCRVLQIPISYGQNQAFLEALSHEISSELNWWFQYVYLVVQDVEQKELSISTGIVQRFQSVERSTQYRISGFSRKMKLVAGPVSFCTGTTDQCKHLGQSK